MTDMEEREQRPIKELQTVFIEANERSIHK